MEESIQIQSNLDLFSINATNFSFSNTYIDEISSFNKIDLLSTLEFTALPLSGVVRSLNEISINVKLRVLKEDKKEYSKADTIQPRFIIYYLIRDLKTKKKFSF